MRKVHQLCFTWLSIHFSPTAAVHSFFAALLYQSRLYSRLSVLVIEVMLLRLGFTEKISPFELMLVWLFNKVSNQPLPDRCIDKIAKNRTGVHAHSFLSNKEETCQVPQPNFIYNNIPARTYQILGDTVHVTSCIS